MKFLLLLLLPITLFAQIPDTSGIVTWKIKKAKRTSERSMSIVLEGHIKKGYYIGPLEQLKLGEWSVQQGTTDISFYADSNWTVQVLDATDGLLSKTNKYKTWIRYNTDTFTRRIQVLKPIDTIIKHRKHHIIVWDTSGESHIKYDTSYKYIKEKDRNADVRVSGKITIKRNITLVPSEYFKAIANLQGRDAPSGYTETKHETKKRLKGNKKLVKIYRVALPRLIHGQVTYECMDRRRIFYQTIPFITTDTVELEK
jgi:hypothetical protein